MPLLSFFPEAGRLKSAAVELHTCTNTPTGHTQRHAQTLHASEREVDDLRAKRKQLEATVKELREGLAVAEAGRERAKRDQAMRARQAEHELKKRETQYNKLKDRLGKFLSERGRDVPVRCTQRL